MSLQNLENKKQELINKINALLPIFPFWKNMDNVVVIVSNTLASVSFKTKNGFQFGWVSKNGLKIHNITNAEQNKIFSPLLHKIQDEVL